MKVMGCRTSGTVTRVKTYMTDTTSVKNAMKRRGSRSTLEKSAEVCFFILFTFYIGIEILPSSGRTVYLRTGFVLPESTLSLRDYFHYTGGRLINKSTRVQKKGVCSMNEKTKSVGEIITLVFKGLALAMSVAAVVLNIMGAASPQTLTLFLGFGLFCLAVISLD